MRSILNITVFMTVRNVSYKVVVNNIASAGFSEPVKCVLTHPKSSNKKCHLINSGHLSFKFKMEKRAVADLTINVAKFVNQLHDFWIGENHAL
jgi:hypothetical protein